MVVLVGIWHGNQGRALMLRMTSVVDLSQTAQGLLLVDPITMPTLERMATIQMLVVLDLETRDSTIGGTVTEIVTAIEIETGTVKEIVIDDKSSAVMTAPEYQILADHRQNSVITNLVTLLIYLVEMISGLL
jgi:hypothetical protein